MTTRGAYDSIATSASFSLIYNNNSCRIHSQSEVTPANSAQNPTSPPVQGSICSRDELRSFRRMYRSSTYRSYVTCAASSQPRQTGRQWEDAPPLASLRLHALGYTWLRQHAYETAICKLRDCRQHH